MTSLRCIGTLHAVILAYLITSFAEARQPAAYEYGTGLTAARSAYTVQQYEQATTGQEKCPSCSCSRRLCCIIREIENYHSFAR